MLVKILSTTAIAAILAAGVLGWQLKVQVEAAGRLKAENAQLVQGLKAAASMNDELRGQIRALERRNKMTLVQIAEAEKAKRQIANELDKADADLRAVLKTQRDWAEAPVPAGVADSVNATLDRLRKPAPGSADKG